MVMGTELQFDTLVKSMDIGKSLCKLVQNRLKICSSLSKYKSRKNVPLNLYKATNLLKSA